LREGDNELDRGRGALAADDHVVPLPALRVRHDVGFGGQEIREEAHLVGVVGDDEEVERPATASPAGQTRP
jgi:hypothetical protein